MSKKKNLAAATLARLGKGVPRHYSKTEIAIRTERLRKLADPALARKRKEQK